MRNAKTRYRLSDSQKLALESDLRTGEYTVRQLKAKHQVSWSTINSARQRVNGKVQRDHLNVCFTSGDACESDRRYRQGRNEIILRQGPASKHVAEMLGVHYWIHQGKLIVGARP